MLWPADGVLVEAGMFGTLEAEEIIQEDDAPKLFTVRGPHARFLVYESTVDMRDRMIRYVAVMFAQDVMQRLLNGGMALYDALDQQDVWAIDHSFDGAYTSGVKLRKGLASVPIGYKPEPGVRLLADHRYPS
ncbi:hypothetical protein [Burkholderia multivorans]|uniref:hypothetical protein n=1 Tax=Burkholderia multivorans TaxID=87883 RepID=UPI0021BF3C29|nr:hypothetical protein [Burkholderia multivorans]